MELLSGLNDAQRRAVTEPGPLAVVAGAGSGKTRTLVHRVARVVRDGADPRRLLVLTFSRKAAQELRDRLRATLGERADAIFAGTFHAYALRLLRSHGRRFHLVDRADARALVRRCLRSLGLPADAPSVARALDAIGRAKGRGAPAPDEVARCYEASLGREGALDLDDLVLEATTLAAEGARGRHDHVLVDEFQDTSVAQFALLRALCEDQTDVCVVGDEDQSIYAWRQAEPANLHRFLDAFAGARVVTLEQNYRSTTTVLEAANAVIAGNAGRIPKRLRGTRGAGGSVLVLECADEHDEAAAIAELAQRAIDGGARPSDVAVLFRVNAQAQALERAFLARAIPHAIVHGVAFVDRAEVRDATALLRLVGDDTDDAAFRRVVESLGKGVGPVALERLAAHAGEGGPGRRSGGLFPAARRGVLPPRYHPAIGRIVATVDGLRALNAPLVELVDAAWRTLGFDADADTTQTELVRTLRDVAARSASLADLLDEVSVFQELETDAPRDAVSLMTLHAAKGLEFSLVAIAGMEEGLLPHRRAFDDPDELAEERRLCYVGMTRAKDRLALAYALAREALGELSVGARSRFVDELPAGLVEVRRSAAAAARARPLLDLRVGDRVRHRRWGEGVVERLEDVDGAAHVTIRFADRSRRMRTVYAPLERIAEGG